MLRDLRFRNRRSSVKTLEEEIENLPVNHNKDLMMGSAIGDAARAPLVAIPEPQSSIFTPVGEKNRLEKTPVKGKAGNGQRTPEKHGGFPSRNKFGWGQKIEFGAGHEVGGLPRVTPRSTRSDVRDSPIKSVNKPPTTLRKIDGNGNGRLGMFTPLYRGLTSAPIPSAVFDSVEVPYFELKEDPSFWMDHNVQVLIRIRPLNDMEKRVHCYSRCLKQESSQTITWVGPPESRFTFDHVACEAMDQETLFRMAGLPMVENCLSGYNSCMFAYGQTGSGKTFTMLGEIDELEVNPSPHRGISPRVFEFLFAKIRDEEEMRKDERLRYSCKCSFLEIYNEQITDLLDPSACNLHLREDMKKGVYVENLSEFEVQTVSDILMLLGQGTSNRKVAATNMNRESSRSHSVFTCVIESQWEKDATTNIRYARLNLVDLAGSERQKTSGAEGERLKEAASINKSLSTLGHVIMVLIEGANGKPKHVPYRDSKLTFLLQDSLGGNSKTMIIANVSSAACCAAETLNTLKFAQRAKLIQNNAVVNEDSSGDVKALQHQIRMLKEELVSLKHLNISRALSFGPGMVEDRMLPAGIAYEEEGSLLGSESKGTVRMSCKQFKCLETTLAGSLRREKMAELSIKQLKAEMELLDRLVCQREEDTRSSKMMLRFREDKIHRMESLIKNLLPADSYLVQENKALAEEIELLTGKLDRNPEVTRFALENIRILDVNKGFQKFHKEGEKEILLSELSELREQLLQYLDGNSVQPYSPCLKTPLGDDIHFTKGHGSVSLELKHTTSEFEECRRNLSNCLEENAQLSRELSALQTQLDGLNCSNVDSHDLNTVEVSTTTSHEKHYPGSINNQAGDLFRFPLELEIFKIILREENHIRSQAEEKAMNIMRTLELAREDLTSMTRQLVDTERQLEDSRTVIEALESQQILLINEIDDLKISNKVALDLLSKKEAERLALKDQLSGHEFSRALSLSRNYGSENLPLQIKFAKMQDSLEKAKNLNTWYQKDLAHQTSNTEEMEQICRQAEVETAEVIVCLQEELSVLQLQIEERNLVETEQLNKMRLMEDETKRMQEELLVRTKECEQLHELIMRKDEKIKVPHEEWNLMTSEIEDVLCGGDESLDDASAEVSHISDSFPQRMSRVSEQIGQMAKIISEKEILVEELSRSLEDANSQTSQLNSMLRSLKGASMVINEAHQQEFSKKEKEVNKLTCQLREKSISLEKLSNQVQLSEDYMKKVSVCATAAFVVLNKFSEANTNLLDVIKQKDIRLTGLEEVNSNQAVVITGAEEKIISCQEELNNVDIKFSELEKILADEKEKACVLALKLHDLEANDTLKTKEKLAELKAGVLTVMSTRGICNSFTTGLQSLTSAGGNTIVTNCLSVMGLDTDTSLCSSYPAHSTNVTRLESEHTTKHTSHGDNNTMSLLRREIESALDSFKAIHVETAKLRDEIDKVLLSERQSQESMEGIKGQLISLQSTILNFEEQAKIKTYMLGEKLRSVENFFEDANTCWSKTKELFETEVCEAKMVAAEKATEASCFLDKFEELKNTIRDADIMITALMIANESGKAEVDALKKDRATLMQEIQILQPTNNTQNYQLEVLEKLLEKDLRESKNAVLELEDAVLQVQNGVQDDLQFLTCDISGLKCHLIEAKNLMHSSFDDNWNEFIMKDCAMSVMHLCHTGALLETLMRLNVENQLLQDGLSEQHSVMADLTEHNSKCRQDLDTCRIVEGKLMADIKNSLDRVLRKEEESQHCELKLISFEQKILDLQVEEESMLHRENVMGCELASLTKELDRSDLPVLTTLFEQNKLLNDKERHIIWQDEVFFADMLSKDIESLVLASKLHEVTFEAAKSESTKIKWHAISENLSEELVLSKVDRDLKEMIIEELTDELTYLTLEVKELDKERKYLSMVFNDSSLSLVELNEEKKVIEQEMQVLRDASRSYKVLKYELDEAIELKEALLSKLHALKSDNSTFYQKLKETEAALELSTIVMANICRQNEMLEEELGLVNRSSYKVQIESEIKDAQVTHLEEDNASLTEEFYTSKTETCVIFEVLKQQRSDYDRTLSKFISIDEENQRLHDMVASLECSIVSLQNNMNVKEAELEKLRCSQSVLLEDLCLKSVDLQLLTDQQDTLLVDNSVLKREIVSQRRSNDQILSIFSLNIMKCNKQLERVTQGSKYIDNQDKAIIICAEKLLQEMSYSSEMASKFMMDLACFEDYALSLSFANESLLAENLRKDEMEKELLCDLTTLQELDSNNKNYKVKLEEMIAALEDLQDEIQKKSDENDELIQLCKTQESQLKDKIKIIFTLQSSVEEVHEKVQVLSRENTELIARLEDISDQKRSIEEELVEKKRVVDGLESELVKVNDTLFETNNSIDYLQENLSKAIDERDHLCAKVLLLEEKLDMAEAQVQETEAIATEAKQTAESEKFYAEQKEEEIRLLERFVEELETTIDVLESKVEMVKVDAEQQRLQREELEVEMYASKHQMHDVKLSNSDIRRNVEKEAGLEETVQRVHILEKHMGNKDEEIIQLKTHISELNVHAEAQACEYKQKLKGLESMAEKLKHEGTSGHATSSTANKPERHTSKPRGSGSPFKCIGLGMGQQMKSEKEEDLSAARQHIKELETVAAEQQSKIFELNAMLASANSMTHDVIRELLGVKLDMTHFASLLDEDQVQKITEKVLLHNVESHLKDQEVLKLKQQLNEFIEERKGWLEEIDRKQTELMAAHVSLENLHQTNRLLKAEYETLNMENVSHKNQLINLENEVNNLLGQQTLQQRIHQHAKVKEENNTLRTQNEELSVELRRSKELLSRSREELGAIRALAGKSSYIDFEDLDQLHDKLKEAEEEKLQLGQKLLALCTSILKAAGITRPVSAIGIPAAEVALGQLMNKITSLERDVKDLKFKNKITNEKARLLELMPQLSPLSSMSEDRSRTPGRTSNPTFLSTLDR